MAIGDRLAGKISGNILPLESALVVNSYYGKDRMGAFVDVVIEDARKKVILSKVPIVKVGGVSSSLPPVGSLAIIAYLDNNSESPICLGVIDSEITATFVNDDKRPSKPPANLTR
jgi:hypothetical protein